MTRRIAAVLMLFLLGTVAFAQKKDKTPTERTLTGIVTNAAGEPIQGAVVQLKNLKTLEVRSFIAREKGDYYFHGLSMDVDYELKAQANGKESARRVVSSFDAHPQVTINFQVK